MPSKIRLHIKHLTVPLAAAVVSCQTTKPDTVAETPPPREAISDLPKDPKPYKIVRRSGPELLHYEELVQLAANPKPTRPVKKKLDSLLSTPFVNNDAYFKNGLPPVQEYPGLGKALRVSSWNIEKSIRVPAAAAVIKSSATFVDLLRHSFQEAPDAYVDAVLQRTKLAASDVLLLQEMDIGHCRSGYLFAADYLAKELGMNYAYAPQQLEVDPVYLGLDQTHLANGNTDHKACSVLHEHADDYRGVFGVAVLSRYPIKRTRLFQLKTQPYDWYNGEAMDIDFVEQGRKLGSSLVFHHQPVRELKVGGRAFTQVDLHVPGLPHETLSVINIHLEIKTTPKQRERQLLEILGYIKDIKNPVIMAGDYNSTAIDVSATSLFRLSKRTTTNPSNILSAGLHLTNVAGINQIKSLINTYKNFMDPLAWHIPVIFPNKVKGLFSTIEDFRFADGGVFDFRGDRKRSLHGRTGTLSNANQRFLKGFTSTFTVPRPIGPIGRKRLDWIFVKSFLTEPKNQNGPYRLAPHQGETLSLINTSLHQPISDHHPITVLLPLAEPDI